MNKSKTNDLTKHYETSKEVAMCIREYTSESVELCYACGRHISSMCGDEITT